MSLRDVPDEGIRELADYLNRFPVLDDYAEQFWYQLASILRKRHKKRFDYTQQYLVTLGQAEEKAALKFLIDLQSRNLELDELIHCLKLIKCQEALNFFQLGATTPVITKQLGEGQMRLKVGQTLNLGVESSCHPGSPVYCWFHDRRPILNAQTSNLIIYNITTGHMGSYCCRMTNPYINDPNKATIFSRPVLVEVYNPEERNRTNGIIRQETGKLLSPAPIIKTHPTSKTVWFRFGETNSVTFVCEADKGVVYDWYKNGALYKKGCLDGRLVLTQVGVADQGEYHCEVVNEGGVERSSKAKLSFVSDIKIIEQPKGQKLRVQEVSKLSCGAKTPNMDRKLNYEWYHVDGGNRLSTDTVGRGQTFSTQVSSNIRGELSFCCKVTDSIHSNNYIYSKCAVIKIESVWITEQPSDLSAKINQRAQLTCTGEGEGELRYRWLKSTIDNGQWNLFKLTVCGVLPFDKLSIADGGYYQCQVYNKTQCVESRIVHVTPLLPHVVQAANRTTIKTTRQPRSLVVKEGTPFRLSFDVVCSSSEPIQYQWYFNGGKISGATSEIYIREKTDLNDCGPYWCEARAGSACVVSKSARIEFPFDEKELLSGNWEQREAERFYRTKNEERFAREKVALLIGNQTYQHSLKLTTPENDIRELGKVLRESPFNFKVFSLIDLTQAEMQASLEMFYKLLDVSGTYAFFYFSGHGFSTNARNNFIVPVDSKPCCSQSFYVDDIIGKLQKRYGRVFTVFDACKEIIGVNEDMDSNSLANSSNVYEIWSCADNTTAADDSGSSTSSFNSAFRRALVGENPKMPISQICPRIIEELRNTGSDQRPIPRGTFADCCISLEDPIMNNDPALETKLDRILQAYQQSQDVPEPYIFRENKMEDLNGFAELHLCFSFLLTNVLNVDAKLHQIHGDKTSKASIEFDQEFLSTQGVFGSQSKIYLDGKEERLCAQTNIILKGLQKLRSPLKLLVRVSLWESGQETVANLHYHFKQLPFIAKELDNTSH